MSDSPISDAHSVADELFARHAGTFGADLDCYRGHVHRVMGLVGLQREVSKAVAVPLGIAAFFHDAGIWFDGTWDYLPPSARRAVAELSDADARYSTLVSEMITEHHRVRSARSDEPLVEAFRRADLTDVSGGLVASPGVTRAQYRQLLAEHDPRGFRPMLLRAFANGLREAPLRPLPMIKM